LNDLDDLRRVGARLVLAAGRDGDTGGAVADALALIADIEREPEARIDALAVATRAVRRALSS
ncbi:MAG: hypothetical protein ACRD0D_03240, partial [Acidimicrobiales bacterium]